MTVRTGMRAQLLSWPAWMALLLLAGCGGEAKLRVEEGTGPDPKLPRILR